MASTCTATPPAATLPSKRAGLDRRLAGNSRLVIAAVFIVFAADRRGSVVRSRGEDDA